MIPRAIETAEIIAPGLGIETFGRACDLCEVHTGEADGLEWAEWGMRYGSFDMEAEPDRVFAPDGESWNSFHKARRVLEQLAQEYEGRTVVAVCHAGVIMASLREPRHRPPGHRHTAGSDEHRAHRVGVGARARSVDAALVQRGDPLLPSRPG